MTSNSTMYADGAKQRGFASNLVEWIFAFAVKMCTALIDRMVETVRCCKNRTEEQEVIAIENYKPLGSTSALSIKKDDRKVKSRSSGRVGFAPSRILAKTADIQHFEWISFEATRNTEEALLMNPKFAAGAFIIRPQSAEGITNSLSLSVKLRNNADPSTCNVVRFLINRTDGSFRLQGGQNVFKTLTELVEHHAGRYNGSNLKLAFSMKKTQSVTPWEYQPQSIIYKGVLCDKEEVAIKVARIDPEEFFSNYCVMRCDRGKKRGGESKLDSHEILVVDLRVGTESSRIILLYRVPALSQACSEHIWEKLDDYTKCAHPTVIVGDFNLPEIKWPKTTQHYSGASADFIKCCDEIGLVQLIQRPTRKDAFLDLLLSNSNSVAQNVEQLPNYGNSDHSAFLFQLLLAPVEQRAKYVKNFRKADYGKINTLLANIDWNAFFEIKMTVNEMYERFITLLDEIIEKYIPLMRIDSTGKPMLDHIHRLSKRRHLAWKANDRKKFYGYIKSKLSNARSSAVDCLIDDMQHQVESEKGKAELLAETFSKVFTKDNGETPPFSHAREYVSNEYKDMFSCFEVCELIEKWKSSSCRTPDNISLIFIKETAVPLSAALEIIFRKSYELSEVPDRWRYSTITPLKKKAPYSNPLNYRPVSITSFFCRVFEKCIAKQMISDCENYGIFPDTQFGFRKNRSWSDTWQLSIASEMCNVPHIGKGNPKADYFLNTSKIEPKSSIRGLGIQIDDELSFKDHFDIVTQKAATRANIIFRGLTTNNAKVMVNAYTTYVRPMVEFCPSVAFPVHEKEAGKLEKLQNKVTRLISYKCFGYTFENRPRPEERNEMLNLKSLTYRRKINDFKQAYEASNLRGAGYKVCKDPFKTKVREKSFANRISNVLYDVLRKGKIPTKYSEFMSVMSKEDPYSPFPSSELYNMLTKENYRLPKPGKCSRKEFVIALADNIPEGENFEITFKRGDQFLLESDRDCYWWELKHIDNGKLVWARPTFLVRGSDLFYNDEWISKNISSKDSKMLLMSDDFTSGAFIMQKSQDPVEFKIRREGTGFRIDNGSRRFKTLSELVRYHADRRNTSNINLTFSVKKNQFITQWEYDAQDIVQEKYLNKGAFGEVFKITLYGDEKLAGKRLKKMFAEDFLKEAQIARPCKHPNVVETIGICSKMYLENGSLKDYMSSNSLSLAECKSAAEKIACGMKYLASKKIVHRDLATRNVLVGMDLGTIKIADFGQARETIIATTRGKVTSAADVWSFGVTPYREFQESEIYEQLTVNSYRLIPPDNCPTSVSSLMQECWKEDRKGRPTFKKIWEILAAPSEESNEFSSSASAFSSTALLIDTIYHEC
ncbi:hypothetical protein PRIPAC_84882, partial [Pristionchus pacificus]|uniref:Tyrosine-protein kinase n=1 Tax=Pristionchus pacificus TaxID=54126 RepID=A0A2A6BTC8_PRIPA